MKEENEEKSTNNCISNAEKKKLKEEANDYYILAKNYRSERYMKEEKFVIYTLTQAFILDKNFLSRWKEFVSYNDVKKQQQFNSYSHHFTKRKSSEAKVATHPGIIDNNRIIVPINEFYNDGDQINPDNIVIRNDINLKEDYKLVNEEIWIFFHSRYGGGPKIIRNAIEEKTKYNYSKKIIEVFYRKV